MQIIWKMREENSLVFYKISEREREAVYTWLIFSPGYWNIAPMSLREQ